MQTAEREEEEEKTIHGGGIYGQVSVYLNTGEGELFDAGHREGYSFVAASSRSYLVNQRGLADCYGVMKYRAWDVVVFLELEEKHEREGEGTLGENLNRGIS